MAETQKDLSFVIDVDAGINADWTKIGPDGQRIDDRIRPAEGGSGDQDEDPSGDPS